MAAYGNMDQALAGLLYGIENTGVLTRIANATIQFGSAVCGYLGDEVGAYPYIQDASKTTFSVDLVASNVIATTIAGYTIPNVTFATSHLATMNAWVNAINGVAGLQATLDASDATNRSIIIRSKGIALPAVDVAVTGGAGQPTDTQVTGSSMVFLGIALKSDKEYAGQAKYSTQDAVNVMSNGSLWANVTGNATANNRVYVDPTTGLVTSDASASRQLVSARFLTNKNSQNLAVVALEGEMANFNLTF